MKSKLFSKAQPPAAPCARLLQAVREARAALYSANSAARRQLRAEERNSARAIVALAALGAICAAYLIRHAGQLPAW